MCTQWNRIVVTVAGEIESQMRAIAMYSQESVPPSSVLLHVTTKHLLKPGWADDILLSPM